VENDSCFLSKSVTKIVVLLLEVWVVEGVA